MDMFPLQSQRLAAWAVALVAFLALLALGAPSVAHAEDPQGGVLIDVNGAKRGLYPIATPTAPEGDQTARQVAEVESFDMQVAGVFKVLDPASFLADLKSEGLGIEPQKWKDVGAYGVMKYHATSDSIEFRLYEVSKGATSVLTKTYPRKPSEKNDTRQIVHRWCNEVVKYYTHEPGFFGSKIVFTQKGKGSSTVIAMDFDGANAYAVSHNSSENILPAWSPDGARIAYTSFMRTNPDLYVGPAGGGRPTRISNQRGMNTGASWSPDGSKIALTLSKDGNPEIYIISASDGSIIKRITNDKAIDTSPAWSPDGSTLAFVSDRNGGPQIFVVSANGGTPTQVSFNGDYNTTPAWSPAKGKHVIAYTTRDGGRYDIVTLDLDSKQMVRITQNQGQNEEPAFSPNGRAIAFARLGQGVFIANADGTGQPVKVWNGNATDVDWGPAPSP
jgi:TolB protein